VAAAILHDRELTLAQFELKRYDDLNLRRFAERVEVRAEPDLHGVAARVDVETINGASFSARCDQPLGAPENRLSRAQIEAKFRTYAPGRLSPSHIDDVIGAVARLEHLASVRRLMDMLRATQGIAD
jgi:2-methylcitrate dehydratase PrpD